MGCWYIKKTASTREIRGKLENSRDRSALWDNQAALKAWDKMYSYELEFDSDEESLEFLSSRLRWIDNQPQFISESDSRKESKLRQDMMRDYFDVSNMLSEGEKDYRALQESLDGVSTPRPENSKRTVSDLMGAKSSSTSNNRGRAESLMLPSGDSPLVSSRKSLRKSLLQRGMQQQNNKRTSSLRPPPESVPPVSPPRTWWFERKGIL